MVEVVGDGCGEKDVVWGLVGIRVSGVSKDKQNGEVKGGKGRRGVEKNE